VIIGEGDQLFRRVGVAEVTFQVRGQVTRIRRVIEDARLQPQHLLDRRVSIARDQARELAFDGVGETHLALVDELQDDGG
jgi:hypothetical protein